DDLLEWVSHFESRPKVFIVHGEPVASQALGDLIQDRFHLEVHIPKWKERLILKPRQVAVEEAKVEAAPDIPTLIFNEIVDLEKELKELKRLLMSQERKEKLTEEDLDRIHYVREELAGLF
ncbi:MAG: MBL fold metallo-hydrolase, partial [Deltaproteobacteria bacterium]